MTEAGATSEAAPRVTARHVAAGSDDAHPTLARFRDIAFRRRAWAFPALLLIAFVVLVGTGINGSSSGMVHQLIDGGAPDSQLLLGHPEPIRSDEWLVNTSLTIDQLRNGLPLDNTHLGAGLNTCFLTDAPCHDWSMVIKPQHWGYLFLPDNQAFAWQWWFLPFVGIAAAYALVRRLMPKRIVFASVFSLGLVFTTYDAWWYLNGLFAPLCLSIAAILVVSHLLSVRSARAKAGLVIALAWIVACVGIDLYPPYVIPCAEVAGAFAIGLIVMHARAGGTEALRRSLFGIGGIAVGGIVVLAYLGTRWTATKAELHTVYPGRRVIGSGHASFARMFDGFLSPHLNKPAVPYGLTELGGNLSEATSFLPAGLLLVFVVGWLLVRGRRRRLSTNWVLVALLAVGVLFLLDMFVKNLSLLARVSLLYVVPSERLPLALGLLSGLLLLAAVWEMDRQDVRPPLWLTALTAAGGLALLLSAGHRVRHLSPVYAGPTRDIVIFAVIVTLVPVLVSRRYAAAGAIVLLAFQVYAGGGVNPLYRGLPNVPNTAIGRAVLQHDKADPGAWVGIGWPLSEVVLEQTGVRSYSGTFPYPVFADWTDLDPTKADSDIYNRYAHVTFTTLPGPIVQNNALDSVLVHFDACGTFAQKLVKHVLSSQVITSPCVRDAGAVTLPTGVWHIYDVTGRNPS